MIFLVHWSCLLYYPQSKSCFRKIYRKITHDASNTFAHLQSLKHVRVCVRASGSVKFQLPYHCDPFFCRPTFFCLTADPSFCLTIYLSFCLSARQYICSFLFFFVRYIARLRFLLSSRSSNLSRLCMYVSLYFRPSVCFLGS